MVGLYLLILFVWLTLTVRTNSKQQATSNKQTRVNVLRTSYSYEVYVQQSSGKVVHTSTAASVPVAEYQ